MTARQRFDLCVVVRDDGCWEWVGFIDPQGYGRMGYQGRRSVLAHVIAWELHLGPVLEGLQLDHLCHTLSDCRGGKACPHRRCVNPEHLEPVTHTENSLRGRGFAAENAVKTHCPRGHEYTPENTYIVNTRSRACRICARQRSRWQKVKKRPIPAWLAS